jgi:hypothetical protein
VLASFDQIKVLRSTSEKAGPYGEITTGLTRIDLESGVTEYVFNDTEGSELYYYKYRFFNSDTLVEDTLSAAVRGTKDPSLDVLGVDELKTNYLFGLDLTNDEGEEYPDSLYAFFIKSAVEWLEHRLDIPIIRTEIPDERHDFYREDYDKYIWLRVEHAPVISVEEVKLILPGDQIVQVFEDDWIHIQRLSGQVQLVPGTGTAGSILLGAAGAWLPLIYAQNKFIPRAFQIKYTAGFGKAKSGSVSYSDPKLDRLPQVITELVGKVASFGPLNIAGDLLGGAGIASQSIGLDGYNQNFNTTSSSTSSGYGARLIQYNKEIKEQIPTLRRYYKGVGLSVV